MIRRLLARVLTVLGLLFAAWSWIMIRIADRIDPEPPDPRILPPKHPRCRCTLHVVRSTVRPALSSWTVQ